MNCVDPGPCSSKGDMHVWVVVMALLWGPCPPVLLLVETQSACRQPGERWHLHIIDVLLQGLAVNRVSMLHLNPKPGSYLN